MNRGILHRGKTNHLPSLRTCRTPRCRGVLKTPYLKTTHKKRPNLPLPSTLLRGRTQTQRNLSPQYLNKIKFTIFA